MATTDGARKLDDYEGRRRRRVGLRERLRNFGTIPLIASVMVTAVLLTIIIRMLDSPSAWNDGSPSYAQPLPAATDVTVPTLPVEGSTPLPEATLSPTAKPVLSTSASPTPATTPSGAPSPSTAPQTTRSEAESATISQGVVASNHTGYSGSGFVDYTNVTGSYVQWTVNARTSGSGILRLRFANGTTAARPMDIVVNGVVVSAEAFGGTGSWDSWQTRTITLTLNTGQTSSERSPPPTTAGRT